MVRCQAWSASPRHRPHRLLVFESAQSVRAESGDARRPAAGACVVDLRPAPANPGRELPLPLRGPEDPAMRASPRSRLVVAGLLAVAFAALLVVALASSGGGESSGGLRLEAAPPAPDGSTPVTVYLEDEADNVPATAKGRSSVQLRCVDDAGETVIATPQAWPFTDTDSGTLEPHAHVTFPPPESGQVARCLLDGTEGPLEGSLGVRG